MFLVRNLIFSYKYSLNSELGLNFWQINTVFISTWWIFAFLWKLPPLSDAKIAFKKVSTIFFGSCSWNLEWTSCIIFNCLPKTVGAMNVLCSRSYAYSGEKFLLNEGTRKCSRTYTSVFSICNNLRLSYRTNHLFKSPKLQFKNTLEQTFG